MKWQRSSSFVTGSRNVSCSPYIHRGLEGLRQPVRAEKRRATLVGGWRQDNRYSRLAPTARLQSPRRDVNVTGNLFVDESCIDCDTCRWMVPEVYTRVSGKSAVTTQPEDDATRLRALQAAVACPTGSIRTEQSDPLARSAAESFPALVSGSQALEVEVYHLGYHSCKSYGAASYLIHDKQSGINIMVDSPRYNTKLVKAINDRFGGVNYIYLTHVDDVAEHAKLAETFGAERVIHESEASHSGLDECEIKLKGEGPWEPWDLPSGRAKIYFQPGHSIGHTVLVYDAKVAFTGDHLARLRTTGELGVFINYCWFSLEAQLHSLERLCEEVGDTVKLVLPGHGRPHQTDRFSAEVRIIVRDVRSSLG